MTDDNETVIIEPAAHDSLLEQLRARRVEQTLDQHLDVLVPGYSGRVALRCWPLDGRTQSRLIDRMNRSRSPDKDAAFNSDLLINACHDVMVRGSYDEEWQSIGEYDGGGPVRIEERLIDMLKLDPQARNARGVLRSLFALAPSPDTAIVMAASEYSQWAGAVDDDQDEAFVGET